MPTINNLRGAVTGQPNRVLFTDSSGHDIESTQPQCPTSVPDKKQARTRFWYCGNHDYEIPSNRKLIIYKTNPKGPSINDVVN